jgi:hypothetical protein
MNKGKDEFDALRDSILDFAYSKQEKKLFKRLCNLAGGESTVGIQRTPEGGTLLTIHFPPQAQQARERISEFFTERLDHELTEKGRLRLEASVEKVIAEGLFTSDEGAQFVEFPGYQGVLREALEDKFIERMAPLFKAMKAAYHREVQTKSGGKIQRIKYELESGVLVQHLVRKRGVEGDDLDIWWDNFEEVVKDEHKKGKGTLPSEETLAGILRCARETVSRRCAERFPTNPANKNEKSFHKALHWAIHQK